MSIPTAIAIYLTIWWTALFAILPLGVQKPRGGGRALTPDGGDPSSPVNPKLKRKFSPTTWVSAILFTTVSG